MALVVGVTAVLVGILAGLAGHKLGSTPAQPVQILCQAEAIQIALGQAR